MNRILQSAATLTINLVFHLPDSHCEASLQKRANEVPVIRIHSTWKIHRTGQDTEV